MENIFWKSQASLLSFVFLASCGRNHDNLQCGVSSLVALLEKTGKNISYDQVRRSIKDTNGKVSFEQMQKSAEQFGIVLNGFHLGSARLLEKYPGAIVELENQHFVAVLGSNVDRSFSICDSKVVEDWIQSRLESEWTGNVLVLEKKVK